jgi:hypothetical protein
MSRVLRLAVTVGFFAIGFSEAKAPAQCCNVVYAYRGCPSVCCVEYPPFYCCPVPDNCGKPSGNTAFSPTDPDEAELGPPVKAPSEVPDFPFPLRRGAKATSEERPVTGNPGSRMTRNERNVHSSSAMLDLQERPTWHFSAMAHLATRHASALPAPVPDRIIPRSSEKWVSTSTAGAQLKWSATSIPERH